MTRTWEDAGRTESHSRVRWSLGASETVGQLPAPRHRTSGTIGTTDVPAVGQRGGMQGPGPWRTEERSECAVHVTCFQIGRGCVSSLWWRSRTAHCCLLARGRMSVVRSWFVHDSPSPLGTQRQRQPLPVEIFEKKTKTNYPPGPPPGEGEMHLPSPEAVPSLSGLPVPRPLAPPLTASRRGPGRAGRPAYT